MHPNEATLNRFYAAFAALDADTMAACYAPEAVFDDPAFSLRGQAQVGGMWQMLCGATQANGRSAWKLAYKDLSADSQTGKAHWEADYRFSATGRMVHNSIDSVFEFNPQGLIIRQRDSFSFWNWSRQALGLPGLLLGWSPSLKRKVRSTAAASLKKYLASRPA